MANFKLSPLHQVEYTVRDLDTAQRFFAEVFGEPEVEADFSNVLCNPALDISHWGFGQTVQQICEPLMEGLPHYDALKSIGNCVHNLTYLVDSIDAIATKLRDAGFEPLIEFPLDEIWQKVLPADNITGNHHSYIFDTRARLGFQLELSETPWKKEPQPPLMLPAHGPQWLQVGANSGNTVKAINVVVNHVDDTLAALESVFGDNLGIHEAARTDESTGLRTLLVELGSVPIRYIQPVGQGTELAAFLAEHGPLVHSLVAEVDDLPGIESRLQERGIKCAPLETPVLFDSKWNQQESPGVVHVRAFEEQGADFILYSRTG